MVASVATTEAHEAPPTVTVHPVAKFVPVIVRAPPAADTVVGATLVTVGVVPATTYTTFAVWVAVNVPQVADTT